MIKKLCIVALLLNMQVGHAVNVNVYNNIPVKMYARWEFVGDYFRREIPAAILTALALQDLAGCQVLSYSWKVAGFSPVEKSGWMGVNDWRLHKGFSDVHTVGAKVGDIWGRNPDTGCALVFTQKMFEQKAGVSYTLGQCWGIDPDLYSAPAGQAVYNNFALIVIAVKNDADKDTAGNAQWWPKFRIFRLDADFRVPGL
ncbi:MAG TPA: hypothetical protein VGT41_03660 [Candidatus Babeliales bacterium]|nr:hypothetical protein [Candidatus Babeliales bacterium]